MSSPKLRVGIAGAGWVAGDRHVPSILSYPGAELVAIYDRSLDRATALADRAAERSGRAVHAYDDRDAFFALGLDVVHVTSSPWSHHDLAIGALDAGAHVFTEKPMAMDADQAAAMAAAADRAQRLLCVSHNFLWSDAMQRAKRRLDGAPVDYVLGLQLSADTRRLPDWYRDLPGGLMFDEAPHMLYSLNDLLGGGLQLDHARGTFDDDSLPRTVEVLVRGRTGLGQVTMVFCSPVSEWHLLASSAERLAGLDLFRDIEIDIGPDGRHGSADIARTSMSAIRGHVGGFARAGTRWVRKRQFWGHDVLIHAFLDAVAHGGTSPVPIEDALGIVALTDTLLDELGIARRTRPV